jgi:hypothetical protein
VELGRENCRDRGLVKYDDRCDNRVCSPARRDANFSAS